MNIVVKEATTDHIDSIKINDIFTIDSMLVLSLYNNEIEYQVVEIPSYEKSYNEDEDAVDYQEYIDHPDKTMYLAFMEEQVVGQIILSRNWNNYAYIEDIKVDKDCRRYGIGRKLIEHAKHWAIAHDMRGIMLETQNTNVKACRFYESCGFKIGGFDCNLYKGINKNSKEIAIFWYFMF